MTIWAIARLAGFGMRRAVALLGVEHLPGKLAAVASICVAGAALYLGSVIAENLKDSAIQRAGAAAALYMDSFVTSYVQELATRDTLSAENREALEQILSPASMHRPIVAFRIWKNDTIVFSNERGLDGKMFPPGEARERAFKGHIGIEFDVPGGEDDEQVRALKVPILEVYAPVRQRGTGRIIGVAETYEIAVALNKAVWAKQLKIWAAVAAVALAVIALLFYIAGTGRLERARLLGRIGELSHLREEGEHRRRRMTNANIRVSETNEQSLRRVATDLQHGPVQTITLALLKLDPVHWTGNDNATAAEDSRPAAEIETIRGALTETIRQMDQVCTGAVPSLLAELSPSEMLAAAAREHYRRNGGSIEHDLDQMPPQLPLALKACLYRIVLEGLRSTAGEGAPQSVRCKIVHGNIVIEIAGSAARDEAKLASLRDRIEALGGTLRVGSTSAGQLSLTAEIDLSDMGIMLG